MKKLLKRRPVDIFLDLLTVLLLTVSLFPLYYMIVQSIVDWKFVDKTVIPSHFSPASYDYLFHTTNANDAMMWLRALGNSLLSGGSQQAGETERLRLHIRHCLPP